jgi:CDGSH-type Zn-finger protein
VTKLEEQRGDTVSMSEVVVRSTENGPNLVIVDGKVVQARCRCGGSTLMSFSNGSHKKNGFTAQAREIKVR